MSADPLILSSPLAGWACPLDEVPDRVFADRMMGDGIAIHPTGDTVHAPCDATIVSIHEAGHAVSLRTAEGVELLIHVGLDTVALRGEGFSPLVKAGQTVARGDPLIHFDLDAVATAATSAVTPIIVANPDGFEIERAAFGVRVDPGDPILTIRATVGAIESVQHDDHVLNRQVQLLLPHGIHARPAARLGACAREHDALVEIVHGDRRADARSTVALLALGTRFGDEVTVEARGPQAAAALDAVATLLATTMGEDATPAPSRAAPAPIIRTSLQDGQLPGVCGAPGLAMGSAHRLVRAAIDVAVDGGGVAAESAALADTLAAVSAAFDREAAGADGDAAAVLRAQRALLEDPELLAAADTRIAEGRSAGHAWRSAIEAHAERVRATGNARLIERIDDLHDVERRVLAELAGDALAEARVPAGAIIVADELLPSQMLALAGARPAGICLSGGGPTSHVAILAAGMGLPLLVAIGNTLDTVEEGMPLLLDADAGWLDVSADSARNAAFAERIAQRSAARAAALKDADRPCRTADGTRIEVVANLGSIDDAHVAARHGAEGSGLVRSEFLFLDRDDAPSADEQTGAYQAIADTLVDRPVIVRLLDIGGDKPARYVAFGSEENPALGLRGIRLIDRHPDLIETQLRAILAVRPAGQCRIMLPMVTSVEEIRRVRAIVDRLRDEAGIDAPVAIGVMVETPAAAATADLLAAEADFLSIGTNDLTQYVLAMDRGNPAVAAGVDAMHPAVLRMIAQTCTLAVPAGRWVGVCGGLASDPLAIPILVGLGITELSTVPTFVPDAKAIVGRLTLDAARTIASRALACASAAEVRTLASAFAREVCA